jgi:hypothetical protein
MIRVLRLNVFQLVCFILAIVILVLAWEVPVWGALLVCLLATLRVEFTLRR